MKEVNRRRAKPGDASYATCEAGRNGITANELATARKMTLKAATRVLTRLQRSGIVSVWMGGIHKLATGRTASRAFERACKRQEHA